MQVTGRRPLGRDPELDYEVMSDQDWEEEPEGESLSVRGNGCAGWHNVSVGSDQPRQGLDKARHRTLCTCAMA